MSESALTKKSENKGAEPVGRRVPESIGVAPTAPGGILGLHGSLGNRAVSRLVENAVNPAPVSSGVIQRKCECGGGSCSSCRPDDERVQTKSSLPISEPGDVFEREADSVADRAMQQMNGSTKPTGQQELGSTPPVAARASSPGVAPSQPSLSNGFMNSQSAGNPMSGEVKERMENALGYDFGGVRVHNDSAASSVARDIHSEAFTYRSHIFFREGRYRPHLPGGQRLLAHELAHVVQQGGAHESIGRRASSAVPRVQRFTSGGAVHRSLCAADVAKNGLKFPCKGPPFGRTGARSMGTQIHTAIKNKFRKPPNNLTEVPVPGGSTGCREAGLPWWPATGSADLVKVVRRTGSTVRIQVGEIKPMNLEGVALGSTQSLCYAEKINDVGDLCKEIYRGRIGKIRQDPADVANSVRPILNMCMALGASTGMSSAPGKTVVATANLSIRGYTFSAVIGGRPRRIKVRTCLPGVIGYTCEEEKKKKKKKKKNKKKTAKKRRPPKRTKAPRPKTPRATARKLARLKSMKKKLVKSVIKSSRRVALKAGAKVAARLFARAIPVLGWILTAIDIAEAIYNISKYGLNFGGGGEGGPEGEGEGAEGAEGGTAEGGGQESAAGGTEAEGGQEGAAGGTEAEGGQEGAAGGTEAEGGTEGTAGGSEGKGTQEGEGGEKAAGKEGGEGGTSQKGTATEGEGGTEAEAGAGGKAGTESKGKQTGEDPLAFLSEDEKDLVEDIVDELPLSPELIEALKNSTIAQQQFLDIMVGRMTAPGQPRPTEEFFKKLLELSEGLTPEQVAALASQTRPVKGESLEEILKKAEAAVNAIKSGATGKPAAKDESKPAKDAPKGDSDDGSSGAEGTGKGKGKKPGASGEGGKKGTGGADEGGTQPSDPVASSGIEPAKDDDPNVKVIRSFEILSGADMNTEYPAGTELKPIIRVRYGGERHEIPLPIIVNSRTKTDTGVKLTATVKAPPPELGNVWRVKGTDLIIPTGAPFTYQWTVSEQKK
ncbi:MAG TPA: DUF4157 domain-containing protein [Blastocatellia bacterium]|nr:DUF4157 domain-containing protein [Blastocatellia bacterium]